jgi:membrane protein
MMLNGVKMNFIGWRKVYPSRRRGTPIRKMASNDQNVDAAPEGPTDLPKRSWRAVLKRTVKEFQEDNLTDWAAALTYYGVMSLFPMLIALVAVLGLVGQESSIDTLLGSFREAGLGTVASNVEEPLHGVVEAKGGAGALLTVGLLGSLWAASGYLGAFMRAANQIYEVREGRPFWKLRPIQVGLTLLGVFFLSLVAIGLVVTGPFAEAVGNAVGLGSTAVTVWSIAKWPVMLLIVMTIVASLYYIAPNVRQPRFRWITPGGILAVVLWVLASVGFGFYVANFGSYNATYGTLGGVITFLVWMWISNLALLLGAEFDAELERERELLAGLPAEQELKLPPREPASS